MYVLIYTGRIPLQHTRIAVAFARNFLLLFSSKTKYAYAANECAQYVLKVTINIA